MAVSKGSKKAKSGASKGKPAASKKSARPQDEGKKAGTRVSTLGDYRSAGGAKGGAKGGGKGGGKGAGKGGGKGGSGSKLRDGSR
jgi:hypothetical protein